MSEEVKTHSMTPEEQMEIWRDTFDYIGQKAKDKNIHFNIFDLQIMLQRGMADLVREELAPHIADNVKKFKESSIPEGVVSIAQKMFDYIIEEGGRITEGTLNPLEFFFLASSAIYTLSETTDMLLQDAILEKEEDSFNE